MLYVEGTLTTYLKLWTTYWKRARPVTWWLKWCRDHDIPSTVKQLANKVSRALLAKQSWFHRIYDVIILKDTFIGRLHDYINQKKCSFLGFDKHGTMQNWAFDATSVTNLQNAFRWREKGVTGTSKGPDTTEPSQSRAIIPWHGGSLKISKR